MRFIGLLIVLFLLADGSFAQSSDRLSKEELAIKDVIEAESKYFWARDYDKWQALYVHAPYTMWAAATKDGVSRHHGWEAWSQEVQQFFKNNPKPQDYEGVVYKYNYQYRIYGNGAWVSFEQMNDGVKTWENRILEKDKGKWKIAMVELMFNLEDVATGQTTEGM